MSILIAEDNVGQRRYLRELLEREFAAHAPVLEAGDGEEAVRLALQRRPGLCVLDIQMPGLSGVKAARAIWREFPEARVIFWTQFPHEVYINEIRKIIRTVTPPPAYGFIHKNNPESRFLRFVAAVLEDGADMIDPAFKDSFKRPLLTEFEAEALYYLALGLSNWTIARKCALSLRGVESRLATLYEKLFISTPEGTPHEAYDKLAYNVRTRAFFEALRRGLINADELEKAEHDLAAWIERDRRRFDDEQKAGRKQQDSPQRRREVAEGAQRLERSMRAVPKMISGSSPRILRALCVSAVNRRAHCRTRRIRRASVALLITAFSLSALLPPSSAQKQPDDANAQVLNLHQWGAVTLFHGLPSDRVRSIAQDDEGMLWFGTDSGLAKYDGRRTQTVAVEGLAAGRVHALGFDAAGGALWVGTEGGAAVLRDGRWRVVEETKGKAVTSFLIEGRARALLATTVGQVFECALEIVGVTGEFAGGRADGAEEFVVRARAFPTRPLRSADADNPGELGLTSLARGIDGALYAGTRSRGLLVWRGENFEEVLSRPRPFFVEALERDAEGQLWIGARGAGAGLYAAGGVGPWRKLAEVQSAVAAIRRDAGGDLWVGTTGQGALRFSGGRLAERFTFEGTAGGLRSDNVYTIFIDREGVVWFGTDRGVCRFDPRSPRNETVSPERESNFVRSLLRTRDGELLCGTNRGLFAYDERAASWSRVEGLADKTVHALSEDARGRLLVGTSDGLYAGTAGSGRTLERQEAEGPEVARASVEGAKPEVRLARERERVESVRAIREYRGATYIAVYDRGVERIDGERRTLVWPPRDFDAALREVTSLHAEGNARLWIGTGGAGLYALEGDVARRAFGEALRGRAVWDVEGAAATGLWIATSAGLYYSRDGTTLEMIVRDVDARAVVADAGDAPGESPSVWVATAGAGLLRVRLDAQLGAVVSRLDVEQGLASSHAFALLRLRSGAGVEDAVGAATERPAGENSAAAEPVSLVVGTTRGIVRYRPGAAAPALMPMRVLSRRLHQPRELREGFTLPYPQNSLALDVAALSTRTFPEQFQYVFTLRAGDGREIRRKLSGEAQFVMENLPPGAYTVETRAFTKDLIASEPLSFAFTVARAPFPRTVAALAVLLVLALVALLWGAWQNRKMARATTALAEANHELAGARLNLANEAERERRRIARDLHDQTLADLRSLMLLTDQLPSDGANGNGAPGASDNPGESDARGISGKGMTADKGVAVDPAVFRAEIESISDEIRRICEDLSPSALDNVGLAAALEWALTNAAAHCRESERFEYEFISDEDFDERLQVAPGVRMQIYRIAQEAITNVCRHARARRVRLSVSISAGGELLLAIEDDGRTDFDPRARKARRGRGLSSIRDRASLIEAEADWERLPTGGTRFTLRKANAAKDAASAL